MTRATRKQFWINEVREFRASGKSRAAFCRERGYSIGSLRNWERFVDLPKAELVGSGSRRFAAVMTNVSSRSPQPSQVGVRIRLPMGIEIDSSELPRPEWIAEVLLRLRTGAAT